MRCIWTLRSIHTCIGIGTLQVSPVRFASFKQVLSLCASHVMHMTSMGLGSCPIDSLPCLMHRISFTFSCCLWRMSDVCVHSANLGLQHRPMESFGLQDFLTSPLLHPGCYHFLGCSFGIVHQARDQEGCLVCPLVRLSCAQVRCFWNPCILSERLHCQYLMQWCMFLHHGVPAMPSDLLLKDSHVSWQLHPLVSFSNWRVACMPLFTWIFWALLVHHLEVQWCHLWLFCPVEFLPCTFICVIVRATLECCRDCWFYFNTLIVETAKIIFYCSKSLAVCGTWLDNRCTRVAESWEFGRLLTVASWARAPKGQVAQNVRTALEAVSLE